MASWRVRASSTAEFSCGTKEHPRIAPDTLAPVEVFAMQRYSLDHVAAPVLRREMFALDQQVRGGTALLLAHIGSYDARKLYVPEAYPTMRAFLVGEMKLTEDRASKRIQAARTARDFPVIFEMLADGRLHLTAVVLLSPHLKPENVEELLPAAAGKSARQIVEYLEARAASQLASMGPALGLVSRQANDGSAASPQDAVAGSHAARHVISPLVSEHASSGEPSSCDPASHREASPQSGAPQPEASQPGASPQPGPSPHAEELFPLRLMLPRKGHDLLRRAQDLLGHTLPSGDPNRVVMRALEALVRQLEKRKFGVTDQKRQVTPRRRAKGGRYIPVAVRNAVYARDGGRCTFVSASGHRCEARKMIEFHHIDDFARGGEATVDKIQLRCKAHNQYAAEQTYGAEFMRAKREKSKRSTESRKRSGEKKKGSAGATDPARTEARRARDGVRRDSRVGREQESLARAVAQARALEEFPWLREMSERSGGSAQAADGP